MPQDLTSNVSIGHELLLKILKLPMSMRKNVSLGDHVLSELI